MKKIRKDKTSTQTIYNFESYTTCNYALKAKDNSFLSKNMEATKRKI